jgi:hypothetical protein
MSTREFFRSSGTPFFKAKRRRKLLASIIIFNKDPYVLLPPGLVVRGPAPVPDTSIQGCGSGFNRVSGSDPGKKRPQKKRAKMTHKSRFFFQSSCFEVLDGLF